MPLVIDEKTAKEVKTLRRIAEDAMALMGDAIQRYKEAHSWGATRCTIDMDTMQLIEERTHDEFTDEIKKRGNPDLNTAQPAGTRSR